MSEEQSITDKVLSPPLTTIISAVGSFNLLGGVGGLNTDFTTALGDDVGFEVGDSVG